MKLNMVHTRTDILYVLPLLLLLVSLPYKSLHAQAGWTKAYDQAVVVTADRYASEVGKQILEQGGNAVDAAVAIQFTLAVTLPRAGNIGGGGFMLLHLADGTSTALDFRETAPLWASRNMFISDGEYQPELSRQSILSSGVPGVVDGMIKALERYGRLPLETVMAPAIRLAREGYLLSWSQARDLNDHAEAFNRYESSRKYFTKPGGQPFREGDLFIQQDLANTLERIAQFGREGFYAGLTADLIVREMERYGGLISSLDLRNYDSVWREPVRIQFKGYELHAMPPPSSGGIALAQMLDMLSPYNLESLDFNTADYIHLVSETMRRAFADRARYLGDPDFMDIPGDELTGNRYNRTRMQSFNWDNASQSQDVGPGMVTGLQESSQTTHFSIVDQNGNAVSVTTTLNGSFGNHISVMGAGFLLNNEMDDFTAQPGNPNMYGLVQGEANAIEPGKRMLSSMTPVVVTRNGEVRMVLGAAGGPRIISAVLQNFLNMAVFGMNAQEALSAPRFHHQWIPDQLYHEKFSINRDTRELLLERGHRLEEVETVGRSQIIYIDAPGTRNGATDPRGDGYVAGY